MLEALAYTLTNPQDSLELFHREVPEMALNPSSKEFARIGLGMWQHGIDRLEAHDHGLGWSDPAAYAETTDLVMRYLMEPGAKRPDAEAIFGTRISFIPQDPYLALNPAFKVGTQLLEIMRWHALDSSVGRGRDKRHRDSIVALLRRVQLPDPEAALERYPHQFSGGQRQRLVIAAALATAPALVIADEPTTALDVTTQQQILDLLRELAVEFGLSMLFVTHDLGVVAQLCDDLCVIYAGQLVESGNIAELLARPRHPYTKALLACRPDRAVARSAAYRALCRRRFAPAPAAVSRRGAAMHGIFASRVGPI